jgi:hypothetical protein
MLRAMTQPGFVFAPRWWDNLEVATSDIQDSARYPARVVAQDLVGDEALGTTPTASRAAKRPARTSRGVEQKAMEDEPE